MKEIPVFNSPDFLLSHIKNTMAFYDPVCVDPKGGFFQHFRDDGSIYDHATRHLVSSSRFVFNYAMAAIEFDRSDYLAIAKNGLDYLNQIHLNSKTGGYNWLISGDKILDDTNHAYGLAFVLLANAIALKAGIQSAKTSIDSIWQHLQDNYWEETHSLYRDELNAKLESISDYRGQNANMHLCEAMLMAYEATQEERFLNRAYIIASSIDKLTRQSNQFIWEHFDINWKIDWEYNLDDPKHLFRPWGFQPGHQIEWTKLLLILFRHRPEDWMVEKAQSLFDRTLEISWDSNNGGIFYGFSAKNEICDSDKYFWVQAEAIAAAAMLATQTNQKKYWDWYNRIWGYSWQHMIDHQYGGWYRILTEDNKKYDDLKSPAGKTDYHTMGACYEVLRTIRAT